eukprot:TRINITY_DN2687_c0_g1_i3.p1 TRINITY_DN2687_c0_g1~~TRINITY_DN2687_c0_g1_i3.p1  ORF type:complete len:177 (-),score=35.54 TRINITY_DN2687_c0_g1_i3:126-656(-)
MRAVLLIAALGMVLSQTSVIFQNGLGQQQQQSSGPSRSCPEAPEEFLDLKNFFVSKSLQTALLEAQQGSSSVFTTFESMRTDLKTGWRLVAADAEGNVLFDSAGTGLGANTGPAGTLPAQNYHNRLSFLQAITCESGEGWESKLSSSSGNKKQLYFAKRVGNWHDFIGTVRIQRNA